MHKCFKPLSSVSSAILGKLLKSVVACAMAGVAAVASGGVVDVALNGDIAEAIKTAKEMLAGGESEVTVNLAEGTYEPTTAIVLDTAGIVLAGSGQDKTVICGAAAFAAGKETVRGIELKADSIVRDLTVSGWTNTTDGVGVYMTAGELRNVTVTRCATKGKHSSAHGGGVKMTGGLMSNCDITFNQVNNQNNYALGGGVDVSAGTIENCRIVGNVARGNDKNAGVYIRNGSAVVVRGCRISGNDGNAWNSAQEGGAGLMIDNASAVVERCVIDSNVPNGVMIGAAATMRNCLVSGHHHDKLAFAGVYNAGGTLQFCTIVDNSTTTDATGLSGLKQTSGKTVNSILYGNGVVGSTAGSADVTGGTFATNVIDKAVGRGVGCLVADPRFKNAAEGDYRLSLGSAAVNSAAPISGVTFDLDNMTRDADGKGCDIGCYEYVPSSGGELVCAVTSVSSRCADGDTMTLKAFAEGGTGPYTYSWYLDGSAPSAQSGADDTFVWEGATAGSHRVLLVVTDSALASATVDEQQLFTVLPYVTYADVNGGDVYPYDTPAKAAHRLGDAVSAVWASSSTRATVHVAAGTYPITSTINLALPMRILGTNASVTVVDSSGNKGRAFNLANADSEIRGITIANAKANVKGGAAYIGDGLLADAIVSNCAAYVMDGGGLYMDGGVITNTVITGCSALRTGTGYEHGEGLYQSAGRVIGCRFINNKAPGQYSNGLGAYTTGGTIENSIFTQHGATPVMVAGGTLVNCLVYGNTCTEGDNASYRKTSGVMLKSGKVIGCTITGNAASKNSKTSPGIVAEGGTLVNTIVWGNTSEDGVVEATFGASAVVNNNLFGFVVEKGTGNQNGAPRFVDASANDYHLALGSFAVNKGTPVADVAAAAVDFDGKPRNEDGSGWEIGAFEYSSAGGPLACSVTPDLSSVLKGTTVTLTAVAEGGSGTGYSYVWYLDGSDTPVQEGEQATLTMENPGCGKHSVRVVVTDSLGETKECQETDLFSVRSNEAYVDLNGSDTYPYDTEAKAAHSLNDAYDALWMSESLVSTLHVATGTYSVAKCLVLDSPVRVLGAGADKTVLVADGTGFRCFTVSHADGEVADLTVKGFKTMSVVGGGLYVSDGLVRDVRVTECQCNMYDGSEGGGIRIAGGVVRDCEIDHCAIIQEHGYANGNGVRISAGTLERCYVHHCYNNNYGCGLGIEASGGTVRNCRIEGCQWKIGAYQSAALFVGTRENTGNAVVENCTVIGNTNECLRLTSGTVRNVLFAGNASRMSSAAALVTGGTLYNCTFADNGKPDGGSDLEVTGGTVKNTIALRATGGSDEFNCFNQPVTFKNGYRLKGNGNPCVDKGDNSVWDGVADPKDLDGKPRIDKVGKVVDLGCFEHEFIGLMLLVR